MSIPVIQPRAFFGFKTGIKGNAAYITDNEVLYPAAGVLILQNFAQQRQRYIRLLERQKVLNIICVSPNKKFVAIAESGEKPTISMYDLGTLKRKKVLSPPPDPSLLSHEFVAMAFSSDNKFLMAILGDPDWMMYCYNWERGKLENFTKANSVNNPNGVICQIACNPTDNTVVCLVGPGVFRLLTFQENSWRQFGFQKSESFPITCAAWLNFDRLLLGTQDGRLLFVEGGDLKAIYKALEVPILNFKAKDDNLATLSDLSLSSSEPEELNEQVAELITFTRGFAFACGPGTVILFEKETNHKYKKRNVFKIVDEDFLERPPLEMSIIQTLKINVMEDALLATTSMSQLYTVRLWGVDIVHMPEIGFKILGDSLALGSINGLAMCAWKPIFITTGEGDRCVRVWNFQTETQDFIKQYQESINCVAMHPSGLYVLIGFSDKLRFMVLSIDDLQLVREFNIRNCCACSFSANGHLFCALNGNIIHVYATVNFEILHTFKGHNGKVTSLKWAQNDKMLVSCGVDGAVYEWDLETGKRMGEIVNKSIKYLDCVVYVDGRTTVAIADDFDIREISESAVSRSINLTNAPLSALALSRSGMMLFVGTGSGVILSVKFPLSEPPEYTEFNMHNRPITKMCISYNDHSLVTTSEDGSVCIWKLAYTEGKSIKMDKEFRYSTEILIGRDELQEKIRSLRDLAMRLRELEAEHGYQMRQTEASHTLKVKELHEHYYEAIKELKDKNEQMESEHASEMSLINNEIVKMKLAHEKTLQQLETTYNAKLIVEYDKYTMLENRLQKTREDYTQQIYALEKDRAEKLQSLTENYTGIIRDKNFQLDELREETCHQAKEHEEIKQQIEDDGDREIVGMRTRYELMLNEERELNTRLRGESGILKKKFTAATKEVDEYKHTVHTLNVEHQKFQAMILALERDVADLKKEIVERDNTISDKEKRIYELKRKNQELEKYKFVLNYKITELKSQIEPKDREIKEKKDQICDMEAELENLQKTNTTLELQINELREKLNAADNEYNNELRKNRESNAVLRRIRIDLHNAAGCLQNPKKLRDSVKALYHTYSQDREIVATRGGDEDVQKEFMRQRQHLEHTVAALKRQVDKQAASKSGTEARLLQENCTLIEEVNLLRKELKLSQRHVNDMETIMGINAKYMSPKSAREKLEMAVKTREAIAADFQQKVELCQKNILLQKEEIKRLVNKLPESEQINHRKAEKELKTERLRANMEIVDILGDLST